MNVLIHHVRIPPRALAIEHSRNRWHSSVLVAGGGVDHDLAVASEEASNDLGRCGNAVRWVGFDFSTFVKKYRLSRLSLRISSIDLFCLGHGRVGDDLELVSAFKSRRKMGWLV